MGRYDGIDPQDIDPDTGQPYSNYSTPALDDSFYRNEAELDDDPSGHITDDGDQPDEDPDRQLVYEDLDGMPKHDLVMQILDEMGPDAIKEYAAELRRMAEEE